MQKTVVYGLPLNPTHLLEQLRGNSFCVSYATRGKLGKQLNQAIDLVGSVESSILMVDNGAFSAWQAGVNTMTDESYLEGFAAWANDITERCPQAIVVLPDVIDGTAEDNMALAHDTMLLLDAADRAMPVWHMHEPIAYLLHLCETFNYVGVGSSAQYAKVGAPEWRARIDEMFAAIAAWEAAGEGSLVRPRLHMMRGTAELHNYPFDSADSVNVAMNHNRWKKTHGGENHVARMAAGIDAKVQASAGPEAAHQAARRLADMQSITEIFAAQKLNELGFELGFELGYVDGTDDEEEDFQNVRDNPDFIGPIYVIEIA